MLSTQAKQAKNNRKWLYYRTPRGFLLAKYNSQVLASQKTRNKPWQSPNYSKEEFVKKWIDNPKFIELFNQWKNNNYKTLLSPSFDRINNSLGYTFNNIQLVTWGQNIKNYIKDVKYFSATGVIMYDKNNNEINRFNSMIEAEKKTGIRWKSIQRCCHGGRKSTHGFKFAFNVEKTKYKNKDIYLVTPQSKKMYNKK